jgi:uncharacterized protein (TIGR02599 family)
MTTANRFKWFTDPLSTNNMLARPIAENIVAAVFWPRRSTGDSTNAGGAVKLPLTTNYLYDTKGYLAGGNEISRNQLPPMVEVVLVAIDEPSAERLEAKYPSGSAPLLQPGALFTQAPNPANPEINPLTDDLETLTGFLKGERLNYRVYTTSVLIRQSKFSDQ